MSGGEEFDGVIANLIRRPVRQLDPTKIHSLSMTQESGRSRRRHKLFVSTDVIGMSMRDQPDLT